MNWSSVLGLRNGREGPSQIPLSRHKSVDEAQILGWVTQWKTESCFSNIDDYTASSTELLFA